MSRIRRPRMRPRMALSLVRVERAQYRWHAQKPSCLLRFAVLEAKRLAGRSITGRVYCTPKALWKLTWFLRAFGYDTELQGREEVNEKALIGLRGVVKIRHAVFNAISLRATSRRSIGLTVL